MEESGLYRVLLVDDEPLMLAGIKRLVNWENIGCVITGTAANGKEALEKMALLRPDVVICDVSMPGLSGLDVVKQTEREFPDVVFIILTQHEDFELVREFLHYRVVEYMVKNNLETGILEQALCRAVAEKEKRNKLRRVEDADDAAFVRQRQSRIENAVRHLLYGVDELQPYDIALLNEEEMLSCFAFAFIPLNYGALPDHCDISEEERHNILDWETEIAQRLGSSFFPHSLLLPRFFHWKADGTIESTAEGKPEGKVDSLLLFVWNSSGREWETGIIRFREQLIKTSSQITRLGTDIIPSPFFYKNNRQETPAKALARLEDTYYHTSKISHSEALQRAVRYILDNVEKQIMLHDVAEYAHISSGYLSTLFHKEYQQNMVDFINKAKVERARDLLNGNKYRVKEIAGMLGFENAFYFSRVFRRYTGLTPSEFQERM